MRSWEGWRIGEERIGATSDDETEEIITREGVDGSENSTLKEARGMDRRRREGIIR